jgi:branched-chain amino acid aminotransferase
MLVSINGKTVDPAAATVSIFDRGFLFGDAIYEVIRTWGRRPAHLDRHLARLARSGQAIALPIEPLRAELVAEIDRLIAASPGEGELVIRLMITRGASPGLDLFQVEGPPVRIVWVKPLVLAPVGRGLRLLSVTPDEIVGRLSPAVKSNNRQANVMAHRIAREKGHDDGLFVDPAGLVSEGPTWNLFAVKAGRVLTPPLERGILEGITRGLVLETCRRLGIPAEERELSLADAKGADELFITSTTRGAVPVAELDERRFDAPGPIAARIQEALLEAGTRR